MKLLYFVLSQPDKLDDILTEFIKQNIKDATIIDSVGMVRLLNSRYDEDELPFLGAVRAFMKPEWKKNKLILVVLEDEKVKNAIDAIENVIGNLAQNDTGVVFTVPIDFMKGFYKEDGK
ncbi:hypothetical protein [Anaerosacchariphilus polymeriproducens]|uniref:P-II family nitrogen regulator n=1 Tax=Anaerosacchariphilus polymeriproducens TaxID=1812858 RepID=A0A371AW27_9FIRM|nr:hypothetical protein [Anaerosacchariphilus polymeriproducens]RDU23742.1 hypothetical protein DWV06_07745 [Anaerosacchariphilus polymeriproducens]